MNARADRGDALIEFALSVTLFLVTVLGTFEFGLAVWQYNMLADLAQEGARWASVRGSTSLTPATAADVTAFVQSRSLGLNPSVTTTWPDAASPNNGPGRRVQVVVQKPFTPGTSLIPNATMTLRSTAQMIIAR
jgi:Flp pilus assembly protein TadG